MGGVGSGRRKESNLYDYGFFIYKFKDIYNNSIYVGETVNVGDKMTRMLNAASHLCIPTIEWFNKYKLKKILHLDVGHIVSNKIELEYLESIMIQAESPLLNKDWTSGNTDNKKYYEVTKNLDVYKMMEIEDFFYSLKDTDFKEYDLTINRKYVYLTENNIIKIV